jgi:hypothetical protein
MSGPQIFFAIFSIAIALAGLVMALARTRPKDAGSGLSEWLALIGIRAPEWLRTPNTDAAAQNWSARVLLISILGVILSGAVWVFAPTEKSIPISDEPAYGALIAAADPTPPNACDSHANRIPPDTIKVLLGDNVFGISNYGRYSILRIDDCEAVSLERTRNGIFFNAQLQDDDDNQVVRIVKNKIEALSGSNYHSAQSTDRASITVMNKNGIELFYARFLNPATIVVRGFLGCSHRQSIVAEDGMSVPGIFISKSCSINAGNGIQIR